MIQNTRSGSYMCYDLNHRLSATSNVRKAEIFEDSGKAYNVLTHCYPKSQRPDWQVVELPREAAKPDPEQAVRCSDMEANVRGSLRHVVSWPKVSDTLQQIYSEIFAYRAELQDALVRVESELCDCEHACEFFKFDAAKGYPMLKDYIEYFHIKDADEEGTIVPPGCGVAHLAETLSAVNADRTGKVILTIEPHLMDFTGLASLAAETLKHKYTFETPFDAFRTAAESVMRMAESLE